MLKRRAKRISIFLLSLICMIAICGQEFIKIWSDYSVPAYNVYLADYYINNSAMQYWIDDYESPYRTFV